MHIGHSWSCYTLHQHHMFSRPVHTFTWSWTSLSYVYEYIHMELDVPFIHSPGAERPSYTFNWT